MDAMHRYYRTRHHSGLRQFTTGGVAGQLRLAVRARFDPEPVRNGDRVRLRCPESRRTGGIGHNGMGCGQTFSVHQHGIVVRNLIQEIITDRYRVNRLPGTSRCQHNNGSCYQHEQGFTMFHYLFLFCFYPAALPGCLIQLYLSFRLLEKPATPEQPPTKPRFGPPAPAPGFRRKTIAPGNTPRSRSICTGFVFYLVCNTLPARNETSPRTNISHHSRTCIIFLRRPHLAAHQRLLTARYRNYPEQPPILHYSIAAPQAMAKIGNQSSCDKTAYIAFGWKVNEDKNTKNFSKKKGNLGYLI